MIRKSTWILLVIFLAVVAFAWGFQKVQTQRQANITPTTSVAESEKLLDLQETMVTNLRLENNQGKFLVLGRDAQGLWAVLEPSGLGKTDTKAAESGMTQLFSLSSEFSLDMPDNLAEYGLVNPRYTIVLTLTDGKKHTILVGSDAPAVSGYYIRLDNGTPKVVSKFSLDPVLGMIDRPPYVPTETPTLAPEASETPGMSTDTGTQVATETAVTATPQP